MSTIYQGNTETRQTPESPRITKAAQDSKEIILRGKFSDLESAQPAHDSTYDGMIVASSILQRRPGGMGELTITLQPPVGGSEGEPSAEPESTTIEIDMAQVEKPIATNPKLVNSDSIVDEVAAWRNSPQNRRYRYEIPAATVEGEPDPDNDEDWAALDATSKKVAQKIAAGIESWLAFYPVITRTSIYSIQPSPSDYGKIATPPNAVAGFQYLKTADRIIQLSNRKWQRTEQWTGADQWDTDLYD